MTTRTSWPLGNDDFVRRLEKLTGRSLRPRKPGPKAGFLALVRELSNLEAVKKLRRTTESTEDTEKNLILIRAFSVLSLWFALN